MYLLSEIAQLYDNSNSMYFYSTSSPIFKEKPFSPHYWRGPTTTYLASLSTLILRSLLFEYVVTHTELSKNTVIEDVNPYTDTSSAYPPPTTPIVRHCSVLLEISLSYAHYLSPIPFW